MAVPSLVADIRNPSNPSIRAASSPSSATIAAFCHRLARRLAVVRVTYTTPLPPGTTGREILARSRRTKKGPFPSLHGAAAVRLGLHGQPWPGVLERRADERPGRRPEHRLCGERVHPRPRAPAPSAASTISRGRPRGGVSRRHGSCRRGRSGRRARRRPRTASSGSWPGRCPSRSSSPTCRRLPDVRGVDEAKPLAVPRRGHASTRTPRSSARSTKPLGEVVSPASWVGWNALSDVQAVRLLPGWSWSQARRRASR